ncbi:hypothetical protein BUALT_Bualt14G0031900 [Buddleja alternifolia]|uniref:Uncharacterized protein n=1 Tax=Buddleja alternifolia TaxID=168488 RepID=A0AAV6WG92_9LAMI|nr:hypothetical protein BUALT_Bualt14G0031900 [Buddleja alternifolia]
MDEKRAKNLCFWCDERLTPGHQCSKRRQLYMMEVNEEEVEEGGTEDVEDINETAKVVEDEKEEEQFGNCHVSMNAMTGIHDFRTMRVLRSSKGKHVHILIDTGSTHNFLDINAAKKLGCRLEATKPFPVTVPGGSKIIIAHLCREFTWRMQGIMFTTDMMILPLGGCDIVLGIQWLVTLGDINWNFSELKMSFQMNNKKISLMYVRRFNSTTGDEGTLMQLEPSLGNSTGNLALDTLLSDFADLFEVPTSFLHIDCMIMP